MSQDFFGELPEDVLNMCFERLSVEDHLVLMPTCRHIYDILSQERHRCRRRFRLTVCNTITGNGEVRLWNFGVMQRYQAFTISEEKLDHSWRPDFFIAMRAFLLRKEITCNVEELYFRIFPSTNHNFFEDSRTWYFPKLKTIVDHYGAILKDDGNIAVRAPKLEHIKLAQLEKRIFFSYWERCINFEELNVFILNRRALFKRMFGCTFTTLNSLVLQSRSYYCTEEYRFDSSCDDLSPTFAQLKFLKIVESADLYAFPYRDVFKAAVNLNTLIVISEHMSLEAFNAISNIKRLKELCLLIFKMNTYVNGLSLPELVKLTTYTDSYIPLESVPRLKWLCVKNYIQASPRLILPGLRKSLRALTQQLEVLYLSNVFVDDRLVKTIRSFTNLKSLQIRHTYLGAADVGGIIRNLIKLQRFSLILCDLKSRCDAFENNYEECRCWRAWLEGQNDKDFLKSLKQRYQNLLVDSIDENFLEAGGILPLDDDY